MTIAALALGEADAIRQLWRERLSPVVMINSKIKKGPFFGGALRITDEHLETLVAMAQEETQRPLRLEALIWLRLVQHEGSRAHRRRAVAVIREVTSDPDPLMREIAQWALHAGYDGSYIESL